MPKAGGPGSGRIGHEAAHRILTLFTPENDLERTGTEILQSLRSVELIVAGWALYREDPGPVMTVRLPEDLSFQDLDPDRLVVRLGDINRSVFRLGPNENPLGQKQGLGMSLALSPPRQAWLILEIHPSAESIAEEEWEKIGKAAAWVLEKTACRLGLERETAASEATYRMMVEKAWDGIVIHDHQAILFTNPRFRQMFGLADDQDMTEISLHRLLGSETLRPLFEAFRTARQADESPVIFEGRGLRPDGAFMDLEISTFATTFKGAPALQTVLRDITRRKRMEEHLINSERLAAACRLAFNIAHEINNPLGGIVTNIHLLLEDLAKGVPPEEMAATVSKVLRLANRCKIIVGGLLDFARDDREDLEEADLNKIIKETLSLLEGHLIMRGLTILKDLDPDLPTIHVNRTKMEQVFMNLIINAAEAMEGRGRLILGSFFDRDQSRVLIRISDTGPGLSEEHKKRLFEPFFSTKPRARGTGLGLAISHGIIKQHKGSIEATSKPGQGATFVIRLPVSP